LIQSVLDILGGGLRMASPEYVICLDCETPCYSFEWADGELTEVICEVCGNDLPDQFILPDDMEELDEPS
jgi:translation initiation factor 2 beta subunit (eIF-2beta)/eIF-5